jgi:hypothetical protein
MQLIHPQRHIDIWLTVSGWIWVCYVLLVAATLAL